MAGPDIKGDVGAVPGGVGRVTRRGALGHAALLLLLWACPQGATGQEAPKSAETAERVVRLIIDYGDGVEKHFTRLPWQSGGTVLDVLQAASRHPRGIRFQQRGQGGTALITQIDDVGNQGAGGSQRNWIYRVNDQVGQRSAGICPVAAGDTILWRFETYR